MQSKVCTTLVNKPKSMTRQCCVRKCELRTRLSSQKSGHRTVAASPGCQFESESFVVAAAGDEIPIVFSVFAMHFFVRPLGWLCLAVFCDWRRSSTFWWLNNRVGTSPNSNVRGDYYGNVRSRCGKNQDSRSPMCAAHFRVLMKR